jgi:hypothetical protein
VAMKGEDQLTVFASPAAAYLTARDFQGLEATIPEGHSTDIQPGTYGIATGYSHSHSNSSGAGT